MINKAAVLPLLAAMIHRPKIRHRQSSTSAAQAPNSSVQLSALRLSVLQRLMSIDQRWFRRGIRRAALSCAIAILLPLLTPQRLPAPLFQAMAQSGGAIQLKASRVEANSNTGVVTAIGNVRIDYPSRQIFATSAQAQYYSREQRIVLSGNVDVIQEGNTLQAETVTYLIAEGRFVATPGANSQVEAVYLLPDDPTPASNPAPAAAPPPIPLPSPPDELPADLSSLSVE